MNYMYMSHFHPILVVNVTKEEWMCHKCSVVTAKENMIACDNCDEWYHWCVGSVCKENRLTLPDLFLPVQEMC